MSKGKPSWESQSQEVPLDCPHEPSALNLEEHEARTSPQIHPRSGKKGFQVAELNLDPSGHSSLQLLVLSPFLLVDVPAETNMKSPYRIFIFTI